MSSRFSNFYEFGPFCLDASERTLRRGDEPVRLTPKEFETLLVLVRGGGRVMSKEELLKEIWPDTFVEEATLAQNVFTLRKALAKCDEGAPQSYIETVPRRGYRFAAKVHERGEAATATPTIDESAISRDAFVDEGRAHEDRTARPATTPRTFAAGGNGDGDERGVAPRVTTESSETAGSAAVAAPSTASSSSLAADAAGGAAISFPGHTGHPVRAAILIAAAALLGFAALVYAVLRLSVRPETAAQRPPAFQSMKVTRLPVAGEVQEAAISPDGKYLAYITPDGGSQSIWVRQVGAASNAQRVVPPAVEIAYGVLLFSPDSRHIYYASFQNRAPAPALYQVPVLGGTAQRILENIGSPISFSPDGKRFAFLRGDFANGRTVLTANVDGSDERQVLTPTSAAALIGLPAWSPDGKLIACVYGSAAGPDPNTTFLGVTVFNVADGAETKITTERWLNVNQLSWLPDGSGLVLNGSEQELSPPQIWQVSFPAGEARRVTNDLNSYQGASLTADGTSLVAVQTDRIPNIWVAPNGDAARARQITSGTGKFDGFYGVSWTPDGRIVYASIASGSWDIWVMNADGTGQKQLTVGARSNYGPSVSADGRYIIFVSNRAGAAFNVWRMDADGGNPKRLTSGQGENFAHPTPDGRWVVYATIETGALGRVWRVPVDGGEPVAVTDKPSSWPFVSPDGKSVACVYSAEQNGQVKLAVVPIEGGPPSKLFDFDLSFRANLVWMPDNRGLAYLDSRSGTNNVWLQPLAGGKPVQLTDFKSDGVAAYDWSRDGRQLVAARSVETTGVVLIRDFR
ncbi:MAG: winged helix-turn-helix domain-containing protein [Acidobacteria bacterium]|nr:winged helix-turn-helix domain-containing protein [Acidobacteriota bacterium]